MKIEHVKLDGFEMGLSKKGTHSALHVHNEMTSARWRSFTIAVMVSNQNV